MDFEILRQKVKYLMDAQSRLPEEFGRSIGKGDTYISRFLAGEGDQDPSMKTMACIAEELGVSLSFFDNDHSEFEASFAREEDKEASTMLTRILKATRTKMLVQNLRPTMDTVTAWWQENNGRLENCEQLMPYVVLVSVGNSGEPSPKVEHVGPLGIPAQALKSSCTDRMQKFLNSLSDTEMDDLKYKSTTVQKIGVGLVVPQSRMISIAKDPNDFSVEFNRLMLPVTDSRGMPYVLNFATLISTSLPSNQSEHAP